MMRFTDAMLWIVRALWIEKARSLLTIVGFAIGIAAMVILSSLGEGLRLYVLGEFTQFGSHILAVTPGKTETFGLGGIMNTTRPLSLDDVEALRRTPGVEKIVPVVAGTAEVEAPDRSRYTNIYGVGAEANEAWKLSVAQGVFLPDEGFINPRPLAVLGSELAHELFQSNPPLGNIVRISGYRYRVVGVLRSKGDFMGTDMDDAIYIPASRALQMFNRDSLMEVDIFYASSVTTSVMEQRVSKLLIDRHGFEDFTIITQDQMLETMDSILRILKYAGGGLGAISLLVGGVGIATILMITVTERTAEVGLLRALGSTRRQVRNLFLGEAVVLGLIGGCTGVMVVFLIILLTEQLIPGLPVALGVDIIVAALVASMLIGLIAGVNPALKATKLSPVDALRAE
ncbi:MAG: ABC transporter permease [bacterium]